MKAPDFLKKKEVLFSPKTPREELIRWGDHYLEVRRLHDAVAFYRQAGHTDGLQRVRELAVEEGDFLLLQEAMDGMESSSMNPDELVRLAERAEAKGRWHDALKAYRAVEDRAGLHRVEETIRDLMERPLTEDGS